MSDEREPLVEGSTVRDFVIGVDRVTSSESPQAAERTAPPEQLSVLPVPIPGPSGVPEVDAALARLTELADQGLASSEVSLDEHVDAYEKAHEHLQDALNSGVEAQTDPGR